MAYCITTDYHVDQSVPRDLQLQRMRRAGFERIHWCWEWCENVVYGEAGLEANRALLGDAGLRLADTHGAVPGSAREYSLDPGEAAAGLALHRDRLSFTAALGGDVVVLHPPESDDNDPLEARTERMVRALHTLEPEARALGMRFAIENIWPAERNRLVIGRLLDEFAPEYLGYCFDSGHANFAGDLAWLVDHAFERLICVHLHDNDGSGDQHRLPGDGTADWDTIAAAIRDAGYTKPVNFELTLSSHYGTDEEAFLAEAYQRARRYFPHE